MLLLDIQLLAELLLVLLFLLLLPLLPLLLLHNGVPVSPIAAHDRGCESICASS
jgi:hypothetical protein